MTNKDVRNDKKENCSKLNANHMHFVLRNEISGFMLVLH